MSERVNHRTRQEPRPPPPDFGREEKRILQMFMARDERPPATPQQPCGPQLPPVDPDKIEDTLVRAAVIGHTLSFSPDDEEPAPVRSPNPSGKPPKSKSNSHRTLDAAVVPKVSLGAANRDSAKLRHSKED